MGKLFSHAGSFLVMWDEFYLCGLTYSALENARVTIKTCGHMSSHDFKKASGKLFCHVGGPEKQ